MYLLFDPFFLSISLSLSYPYERILLHVVDEPVHAPPEHDVRRGGRGVALRGRPAPQHQVDGVRQQRQRVAQRGVVPVEQALVCGTVNSVYMYVHKHASRRKFLEKYYKMHNCSQTFFSL